MSDTLNKVQITNSGYLKICGTCSGSVDTVADLPTSGVTKNTIYSVLDEDGTYYQYNGSSWECIGGEIGLGGGGGIDIDSDLSTTSTNPVENKVITGALANKIDATNPIINANGIDSKKIEGCGNSQLLSALLYNNEYRMWIGNLKLAKLNLEVNNNSYNIEDYFSYSQGSGTINETYAVKSSSSYVQYKKFGKIVIVNLYDIQMTKNCVRDSVTSIIASGLPKAKYDSYATIVSNASNGSVTAKRIGIGAGKTNVVFWYATLVSATTATMTGQLVYIAE